MLKLFLNEIHISRSSNSMLSVEGKISHSSGHRPYHDEKSECKKTWAGIVSAEYRVRSRRNGLVLFFVMPSAQTRYK